MPSADASTARAQRQGAKAEDEAAFDADTEVVIEAPRWWALLQRIVLGGAALGLLWLAASWTGRRWEDSIVLGCLGCVFTFLAVRGGPRLCLRGDAFQLRAVFKNARGRAPDFLGWSSAVRGGVLLLRRDDLRLVHLPQTMPGSDDAVTLRWLFTYLPAVDARYARRLRKAAEPSRKLAVSRLQAPLGGATSDFHESARDLELASAAHTVALRGYFEARAALHALVEALPLPSISAPYVLDALRVVGDASSAMLLEGLADKYSGWGRGYYARTLGELATTAQRGVLSELARAPDSFVRCESRRALDRLATD